jgi:hypothetical protein
MRGGDARQTPACPTSDRTLEEAHEAAEDQGEDEIHDNGETEDGCSATIWMRNVAAFRSVKRRPVAK